MRRICVSALVLSALPVTALAGPLQITPDAYSSAPQQYAPAQPAPAPEAPRYAQAQGNYGGGFIELLFGGAARQAEVPRAYQPAPDYYQQQGNYNDPAQGYAPSSGGDMAHAPVDPMFDRQVVSYDGDQAPGTIIVDTPHKFLFLVEGNGRAIRYGIGVGRPGFTWSGTKEITAKREWPDWRPPDDMLK